MLEQNFAAFLMTLKPEQFSAEQAISLIDLTLLDENVSDFLLEQLVQKANLHNVAAVCVYPQNLTKIHTLTLPSIKLATVVNFPSGEHSLDRVLNEIEEAKFASEIDYVFPYQTYFTGGQQAALTHCKAIYDCCQQKKLTFKVILESGALPSSKIYYLCMDIISQGCDFLKTSTGKIDIGATPLAVFSMLQAIQDSGTSCGIKISGGVKTGTQAFFYMRLAKQILDRELDNSWFRIGASSLIDNLLAK